MPPEEPRCPCWKWNHLGSEMQTLLPQLSSYHPLPTVTKVLSLNFSLFICPGTRTLREIIKTI